MAPQEKIAINQISKDKGCSLEFESLANPKNIEAEGYKYKIWAPMGAKELFF